MLHKVLGLFLTCILSTPVLSFTIDSMQMSHDSIRGMLLTHEGRISVGGEKNQLLLKTGDPISTGDQVTTAESSVAVIVMKSNSVLVVGPQTTFTVGQHSPSQLQHIHIQHGKLRMQKRPGREKHPNGSVFTFSQDPYIYQADEFEIDLTADEKTLVLIQGQLKKLIPSPF